MEEYLEFAKNLAKEAEQIALKYFGFEVESTWKADNSPLTIADTEINDLVIQRVNTAYPNHSIYGEEKSFKKEGSEYIWVCDPIDGTMQFANGLPIFTFSIALVNQTDGQPVLGLVNDPVMKNMYWASKGSGAYRNGKRIYVTKSNSLNNTYLNIDGSGRHINFSSIPLITALREKGVKIMQLASIIYGGVQVANGKFAGTIFYSQAGHDVAALKILTEEAGGKASDLNGNTRRYDEDGFGFVASNGVLHDQLLECIKPGKL